MSAAGLALIAGGALLIYAGMTGGSLVKALQQVLTGKGNPAAGETGRDAAQTRRPAQP